MAEAPAKQRFRRQRGGWHVLVVNEVRRLRDELATAREPKARTQAARDAPPGYFSAQYQAIEEHLRRAEEATQPVRLIRLCLDWYSGAAIERAWSSLHRASEALLMIQSPFSLPSEFVEIEAAFKANVNPTDPRRESLARSLDEIRKLLLVQQPPGEATLVERAKLRAARRSANVASDTAHASVRSWRNILLLAGFTLGVIAIAVAVVHAFVPGFLSLAPTRIAQRGDAVEPWAVELVGSAGGALAAVLALNRFAGFTDPSGLPTTQALVRIPTAAVTSLLGVVLMQTHVLDVLQPQNGTAVLAYAFVFGYAQEPLLRMVDRQAGKVLDPARGKDEPTKRPGDQTQRRPSPEGL
jgi:hypothetical protein